MLIQKIIENWELGADLPSGYWTQLFKKHGYILLLVIFVALFFSPLAGSSSAQMVITLFFAVILLVLLFGSRYTHLRISKGRLVVPDDLIEAIMVHDHVPTAFKWDMVMHQKKLGRIDFDYLLWLDTYLPATDEPVLPVGVSG